MRPATLAMAPRRLHDYVKTRMAPARPCAEYRPESIGPEIPGWRGILYAQIDLERVAVARRNLDVVGH